MILLISRLEESPRSPGLRHAGQWSGVPPGRRPGWLRPLRTAGDNLSSWEPARPARTSFARIVFADVDRLVPAATAVSPRATRRGHRPDASWGGGEDLLRSAAAHVGYSCIGRPVLLVRRLCRAPLLIWVLGHPGWSGDKMAIGVSRQGAAARSWSAVRREGRQQQGCRELTAGS